MSWRDALRAVFGGVSTASIQHAAPAGPYRTPATAPPGPSFGRVARIAEHRDYCETATWTIPAGPTTGLTCVYTVRPEHDGVACLRLWASAVGPAEDISVFAHHAQVEMLVNGKSVYSRPLDALLLEQHMATETEDRLQRLERMINVLVEQDSPAGEALRRLGGAKIAPPDMPGKFVRPVLIGKGCGYDVRLSVPNITVNPSAPLSIKVHVCGAEKHDLGEVDPDTLPNVSPQPP